MPRNYNFGHPKNKDKKKRDKIKKKSEEEKIEVEEEENPADAAAAMAESLSLLTLAEVPEAGGTAAKFKLVEIPGKGKGLVATSRLPAGTILIEESPLITTNEINPVREVASEFRRLNDEQKNQVLSLHDPGPASQHGRILQFGFTDVNELEKKVARIFLLNCLGLCHGEAYLGNRRGLYDVVSRINHSCAPNAVWTWVKGDKSRVVKQVRIVREIKEGEEILVRYWGMDRFASRDERQARLREWNFTCICEVCELNGDELSQNEKTRKKIRDMKETMQVLFQSGKRRQAYDVGKKRLEIMKSIRKESIVDLPDALMEVCEIAAACKLPSSSTAEILNEAQVMSKLFGDNHIHNFMKAKENLEMTQLAMRGGWMW